MKTITAENLDGRKLKSYGLRKGQKVETKMGTMTITGMSIITCHVNSFEMSKGTRFHMAEGTLKDGTEVREDYNSDWSCDRMRFPSDDLLEQMFNDTRRRVK